MSRRPTREALADENEALRTALDAAEHKLLRERMKTRELAAGVTEWQQRHADERRLRQIAEHAVTSANIRRAIAEVQRDLLLEADRCLPDLRGQNAWQATGPAPIHDAIEGAAA